MKTYFRLVGLSLVLGLLMVVSLSPMAGARTTTQSNHLLPLSPISASTLMAQAIHSGKVHFPKNGGVGAPQNPCTPTPCAALPDVQASEGGAPVNEDPIAANPVKGAQLLSGGNDYNCPNIQGFYTSDNSGATWPHVHCLDNLPGQFGEGDPGVGYDRKNNAYITGIDSPNGSTGEIIFEKSSNNGVSWSAPAIAVNPFFPGGLTDKEWLQIDDSASSPLANCLYISLTQFAPTNDSTITVSHSCDGGATWSAAIPVDTTQLFPNVDQFSDVAIGRDGTVYTSWMRCTANGPTGDCGGTTATLLISKSTDGGNTWSAPSTIASVSLAPDTCGAFYGCLPNTSERVSEIPVIDIDRTTGKFSGRLYSVMYNWTGTYMLVQVATSKDGGATWSTPVRVTPTSDTHDQFFPWLSVNNRSDVGVSWLDRRNDPSNVNYEAFAAASLNGGSKFQVELKIASVPSNPFNDGFGGGFMGDYTGNIWNSNNDLHVSWMDTRNGVDCQDFAGGLHIH